MGFPRTGFQKFQVFSGVPSQWGDHRSLLGRQKFQVISERGKASGKAGGGGKKIMGRDEDFAEMEKRGQKGFGCEGGAERGFLVVAPLKAGLWQVQLWAEAPWEPQGWKCGLGGSLRHSIIHRVLPGRERAAAFLPRVPQTHPDPGKNPGEEGGRGGRGGWGLENSTWSTRRRRD